MILGWIKAFLNWWNGETKSTPEDLLHSNWELTYFENDQVLVATHVYENVIFSFYVRDGKVVRDKTYERLTAFDKEDLERRLTIVEEHLQYESE